MSTALAAVERERYVLRPDGTRVPQTSSPDLIGDMLRLLDVPAQGHVLEIGTGSGFSTALLCHLVGNRGSVVSLDIDDEMVARAADLLREDGFDNAEVVVADGRRGYPPRAPYDRLVAWASTRERLPSSWPAQVAPGGVIVAPVRERRAALKLRVTADQRAVEEAAIDAGFIPLSAEPLRPWEAGDRGRS